MKRYFEEEKRRRWRKFSGFLNGSSTHFPFKKCQYLQWNMWGSRVQFSPCSGTCLEVTVRSRTGWLTPIFLCFLRSWTRSRSTGSEFISYLTQTLMRMRSSRSRRESSRWDGAHTADCQLMLNYDFSICRFSDRYQSLFHSSLLAFTASPHLWYLYCLFLYPFLWLCPLTFCLPFSGEHSLCCDWLQPADWGKGKEDPWPSLPVGSCGGGESRAQWLPQAPHHACVSLPGNKIS